MEIQDAKKEKKIVEESIRMLLKGFQKNTGLQVEAVNLEFGQGFGEPLKSIIGCRIDVGL